MYTVKLLAYALCNWRRPLHRGCCPERCVRPRLGGLSNWLRPGATTHAPGRVPGGHGQLSCFSIIENTIFWTFYICLVTREIIYLCIIFLYSIWVVCSLDKVNGQIVWELVCFLWWNVYTTFTNASKRRLECCIRIADMKQRRLLPDYARCILWGLLKVYIWSLAISRLRNMGRWQQVKQQAHTDLLTSLPIKYNASSELSEELRLQWSYNFDDLPYEPRHHEFTH